ncbi:hypothetical protein HOD38_02220 [archaeon]|nr:hypothetical protein [archaeon]MBT4397057.1 hypothetical protein [archaeon]MBT4441051.1 hypothetical protein [archaeon]
MKVLLNKKGDLAWEYIAGIIIAMLVLVLIIIFTTGLKDKVVDAVLGFGKWGFGR